MFRTSEQNFAQYGKIIVETKLKLASSQGIAAKDKLMARIVEKKANQLQFAPNDQLGAFINFNKQFAELEDKHFRLVTKVVGGLPDIKPLSLRIKSREWMVVRKQSVMY